MIDKPIERPKERPLNVDPFYLVKVQSRIRGLLTRKKVNETYGFMKSPQLSQQFTLKDENDPELVQSREKTQ